MNPGAIIQFLNVTKNYVKGKVTALNGVNLAIDKGEFIVLVGPSGVGNSPHSPLGARRVAEY